MMATRPSGPRGHSGLTSRDLDRLSRPGETAVRVQAKTAVHCPLCGHVEVINNCGIRSHEVSV